MAIFRGWTLKRWRPNAVGALADILPPDGVLLYLKAATLASAIEQIGAFAAEVTGLRASLIHEALMARVAQGVSVGQGVLIPHARLDGLKRIVAIYARPLTPIMAEDGTAITMLFVLLAPKDADAGHLKVLAQVAGTLRSETSRHMLLTGTREEIYSLLTAA